MSGDTVTEDTGELPSERATVVAVVETELVVRLFELVYAAVSKPYKLLEAAVVDTVELENGADDAGNAEDVAACEATELVDGLAAASADMLRSAQVPAGSPERIT
jgi:hypothetical protein